MHHRRHPIPSATAANPADTTPQLRTHRAWDADEHALNLSRWNQTYDQLSPGAFAGSVTELWLPKTQIFVETANRSLRQSCAAWDNSIWFGIPAPQPGLMSMGGKALAAEAVCIRQSGADFELHTAPDFNLYGIVVERESFGQYLESVEHYSLDSLLGQQDVVHLPLTLKAGICRDIGHILDDAGNDCRGITKIPQETKILQERIFLTLTRMLTAATPQPLRGVTTRLQRQRTVDQVRELILEHPETPVSIPDLCQRLHISRRALQNSIEDITGLAPLAYMRALRLNAVRRQLRSHGCSVGGAAYAWGFSHLSQFAQDYRKLFGKRPSETAGHESGFLAD
jgi:AraC family ethanolamine operon transcriptional activator